MRHFLIDIPSTNNNICRIWNHTPPILRLRIFLLNSVRNIKAILLLRYIHFFQYSNVIIGWAWNMFRYTTSVPGWAAFTVRSAMSFQHVWGDCVQKECRMCAQKKLEQSVMSLKNVVNPFYGSYYQQSRIWCFVLAMRIFGKLSEPTKSNLK